jgi:YD repeat-containing protein
MGTPGDTVHDATSGTNLAASEYWHGDTLNVPGATSEKLLWSNGVFEAFKELDETSPSPLIEYGRVTKSGWLVKCLTVAEVGDGVQGFEALSPQGTTYRFDTLRRQQIAGAKQIARYTFYLLASQITDRFGNTVNYDYDGDADHRRLTAIYSNDGRRIDFTYTSSTSMVIDKITSNNRSWQYGYNILGALTTVTRPDGKQWQYDLYDHEFSRPPSTMSTGGTFDECKALTPTDAALRFVATVTHPNGTVGEFTSRYWRKGRANVRRNENG